MTATKMMTVRIPLYRSFSIITLKYLHNIIINETPVGLMMTNAVQCGTDFLPWFIYIYIFIQKKGLDIIFYLTYSPHPQWAPVIKYNNIILYK